MKKYSKETQKSKLDLSNEEVRYHHNEEYGLITVSHPKKNNSKKLPMKDVINKMYHEGGF